MSWALATAPLVCVAAPQWAELGAEFAQRVPFEALAALLARIAGLKGGRTKNVGYLRKCLAEVGAAPAKGGADAPATPGSNGAAAAPRVTVDEALRKGW